MVFPHLFTSLFFFRSGTAWFGLGGWLGGLGSPALVRSFSNFHLFVFSLWLERGLVVFSGLFPSRSSQILGWRMPRRAFRFSLRTTLSLGLHCSSRKVFIGPFPSCLERGGSLSRWAVQAEARRRETGKYIRNNNIQTTRAYSRFAASAGKAGDASCAPPHSIRSRQQEQ